MKIFKLLCLVAIMVASTTMKAQGLFRQLETEAEGDGKVTVEQDSRLTDIINAVTIIPSSVTTAHHASIPTTEAKVKQDGADINGRSAGLHQKARGYRIQVYFGSNQRADQTKAQQAGTRVSRQFPELRAYTSFVSPHWRCRVGDFTRREEANNYMRKLKARGFGEAMVVPSEIYVSAEQLNNR
ncbi:MAG: SPOR domain-containing protein [Bacteroidaceae bacterium]|nr:SPOR domain-containing protein [Bacteroidaceae bacterium]